jgi:hypothetical protein
VIPLANHLSFEAKPVWCLPKEQQTLSLDRMLSDGSITSAELHIADLTFTKVLKSTIGAIAISISMFEAFLPSDDDH